jgi:branched-subunit amino acid aminotransferase/4-amino-4-deoxychorismate lyase
MASTALAASAQLWQWDEPSGRFTAATGEHPVVVDSWLVWQGRVRGYDLHWARFASSIAEYGINDVAAFRAATEAILPRSGLWFPRLELHLDPRPRVAVRLRPAPDLMRSARVWVYSGPDPRRQPSRKGPDFKVQEALRQAAKEHRADEAILLDEQGRVREGVFSNVLWWDGADLCTAADDGAILPGITRRLILDHCADLDVRVRYQCAPPEHLAAREVWITSALHGIRVVSAWDGRPTPEIHNRRFNAFRAYLTSVLRPLPRQRTEGNSR